MRGAQTPQSSMFCRIAPESKAAGIRSFRHSGQARSVGIQCSATMAHLHLWHQISQAGIEPRMEDHFRRKIELTNKISVTAGVGTAGLALSYWLAFGAEIRMFLALLVIPASYLVIPVLNRARRYGPARGLLVFLPPVFTVMAGGIVSDTPVVSMKFALLSVILVPILVFGVDEQRRMLVGLAWIAASFLGMDALMPIIPTPAGSHIPQIDSPLSVTIHAWMSCVMFFLSFTYFQRLNIAAERQLEAERAKSDRLLYNVLPRDIAGILKESDGTIAEHIQSTSILFADIVGFTPLSTRLTPNAVVDLLNELFSEFDRLAEEFGVEKIKTIGDCYMAAAGVPKPSRAHAQALAHLALAMQDCMSRYVFDGQPLALRIGINSGAVTAGVIGRNKFIYDLWGDTVNTASRMESHGQGGVIQITDATQALIHQEFVCASGGTINVKGKGEMHVWHVLSVRDSERDADVGRVGRPVVTGRTERGV
jgi:adenylate cyclase